MKIVRSSRFDRKYRKLPIAIQRKFDEKIRLLVSSNYSHPSLRIKRIRGTSYIWEASIDMDYRFTFEKLEDGIKLRNIGKHPVIENP